MKKKNEKETEKEKDSAEEETEEMIETTYDSEEEKLINKMLEDEFKRPAKEKWDAESILSTRTNHENHPFELKVKPNKDKIIQIHNENGLPKYVLKEEQKKHEILQNALQNIQEDDNEQEEEEQEEQKEKKMAKKKFSKNKTIITRPQHNKA